MAAKKKVPEQKAVTVDKKIDDDLVAQAYIQPITQAAFTIEKWQSELDLSALSTALVKEVEKVASGNMRRPEAMLLSQAHTLDQLFNSLAQKAFTQTHMPHYESFLRLAFKAQGQCRATIQTLSDIKNPSVVYAKQANIANGHQQINNGVPAPRTEDKKNQHNELLTELPNETLDSRRTGETISIDSELATMG
ncbi:hypothetical protein [Methylobacter psychrophilus]|uniref:hypothetical protein n=1 Tax=Methylobacter psychrophilus TaxID=96941 RepID=UPI0021D501A6|nr:hypothetical protein [Methylobacter psychrophilus]